MNEKLIFVQWSTAEPWTSILIPILTRMLFEWSVGYHMMFLLLHDTLQNPRWMISVSPWNEHMFTIPFFLITGFVLFSRYRVPASPWLIHVVSGQTMMNAVTPRGPYEYLSIVEGANSSLELSNLSSYVSGEPVSCRYDHPITDDVGTTPEYTIRYGVTWYSHGLRNHAYVNTHVMNCRLQTI